MSTPLFAVIWQFILFVIIVSAGLLYRLLGLGLFGTDRLCVLATFAIAALVNGNTLLT
jgi:hypothetical protein